jgi:hypothetical protein
MIRENLKYGNSIEPDSYPLCAHIRFETLSFKAYSAVYQLFTPPRIYNHKSIIIYVMTVSLITELPIAMQFINP